MTWILEEPLPIILIGVPTAAILGGFWLNTGHRVLIQLMVVALIGTCALVGIERVVQTDREQVEATLLEIASLVERNDRQSALSFVHSSKPAVRLKAEKELERFEFERIRIKQNLRIVVAEQSEPREARATFNVVVELVKAPPGLDAHQRRYPVYVEVDFKQEGGDWKVFDYTRDDALQGYRVQGSGFR